MKRIDIVARGAPEDVARCIDAPDLPAPGPGQVLFDVVAFPINPADLAFCRGRYRLKPPLPATPGAECVGRVAAVGPGVGRAAVGDLVINLQRENWAQRRLVHETDVLRLPPHVDLRQAAMIRINPPTAALLLSDIVALERGDWLIQNVANSAVGRLVIGLAKRRGLRTINVTRRDDVFGELKELGADRCLLDGDDLPERAREACGGAPIRLGLDAVAGSATARIAACLADDGTVCNYGSMSGEDAQVHTADTVYRGVTLTGFMLGRFLARRSPAEMEQIYADLTADVARGRSTRRSAPSTRSRRSPRRCAMPRDRGTTARSWSRRTVRSDGMIHSIHHLSIAVPDLQAAMRDYALLFNRAPEGVIAAEGTRQAWFSTTNVRLALVEPAGAGADGDAVRARLATSGEGLWTIVFAVDDLEQAASLFARRGLAPGEPCDLAVERAGAAAALRAIHLSVEPTHGVATAIVAAPRNPRAVPSAAAVSGLDHVVIRTPDPERAVALYGARLGLDMRLDRTNPAWGARLLFFRCGDLVVEIAHALKDGVSGGPDGFGGLSWRVDDIEAARARLLAAGRNISDIRKGRRPHSHVCTVRDGAAGVPTILLGVDA